MDKLKMVEPFSSDVLTQGGVPGIRTAFLEVGENKCEKQYVIELDPEIQRDIFGYVLQFIYTG